MARILVVDDDEMNRDMLSRRLERKGFQILLAVNGREAVASVLRAVCGVELPRALLSQFRP